MSFKLGRRGARIKVSPKEERTYNGELFASKAEMEYYRDVLLINVAGGLIKEIKRQPKYELGCPENVYRADFICAMVKPDEMGNMVQYPIVVDVKGMTTAAFARHRRLWSVYGPCPLHIVKRSGKGFKTVEIVVPGVKLKRKSSKRGAK